MKKTTEAINDQFLPAMVFNLPRLIHGENSLEFYTNELRGFVKDLEILTGEKISDDNIRKNIALYNEAKGLLRKISAYRKSDAPLFGNTEYQKIANSYYYLPVEELITQLKKIDKQLEDAPSGGRKVPRILLAGGILAEGDEKVVRILEQELGAKIVVEDTCTGYSPFANDIAETGDDVVESIAAGYLGKAPCARMRPLDDRINHSVKLAEEYKVDAVIYYYIKFCPCYGLPKNEFVKAFQKINIPVLEMPVDYSKGDEGQLKTRIEAFIDVLEEKQ
jgi:benzoyl-CoA reductase/2-hydroxyglutaryl-CoA dehydratase subunit BcrC/BadD/HgdB